MLTFLERLDYRLFFALNQGLSTASLDYLLGLVSVLADGVILVTVVGVALWCVDHQAFKQHYIWLIVAVVVGGLMVQALKYGVARPRPLKEFAAMLHTGAVSITVLGPPLRHRSFPSGHAQAMASVSMYLYYLYPRQWYWWSACLLLVGLSRVYVGVHFPSDVLVGAGLGTASALGVWHLRRYRRTNAAAIAHVWPIRKLD